jgi:class 3 adenylate cyclase
MFSPYDHLLTPVLVVQADLTVCYFNQTSAAFFQLPPRKIRGKSIDEVVRVEGPLVSQYALSCLNSGQSVVSPEIAVAVGADKKEVVLNLFKAQSNSAADTGYVVITVQDFSLERILHAKHRLQLDELKRKNAEILQYSHGLEILVEERTTELRHAMDQSERLILNILPKKIAERLKANEGTIAERFAMVSVLFLDIVSFTPISSTMDPVQVVSFLSEIFDSFDNLVDRYNVEKIKTIGDCYLAAAGLPVPDERHGLNICDVALAMQSEIARISTSLAFELKVRIGIHSGPVVAGVIGQRKFAYDLWGDTVNIASRMESHGQQDRIQISETTYNLVKDDFDCEERGFVDFKGKGQLRAYWLKGRK